MKRLKLKGREKLLFAFPILIILLPAALILLQELQRDRLDDAMCKLAGPNAMDCGVAQVGEKGSVSQCMMSSYEAGTPFYARFTHSWADATGVIMTPQRQSFTLRQKRGWWFSKGTIYSVGRISGIHRTPQGVGIHLKSVPPAERAQLLERVGNSK